MARSVFIDTSGWYALIDRRDAHHTPAAEVVPRLVREGARLVTTDYVLDESCTLARVRAGSRVALRLLDLVEGTLALDLEWIGSERFDQAKKLFRKHQDQAFSFTDCTSFVLMREMGLLDVVTTDEHFRTAGFNLLLARPP